MSYIIGKACLGTCDTACVTACPVDCIHGPINPQGSGEEVSSMEITNEHMLYINPEECIDCGACLPECPVEAIYDSEESAIKYDGTDEYVQKNYKFYGLTYNG